MFCRKDPAWSSHQGTVTSRARKAFWGRKIFHIVKIFYILKIFHFFKIFLKYFLFAVTLTVSERSGFLHS